MYSTKKQKHTYVYVGMYIHIYKNTQVVFILLLLVINNGTDNKNPSILNTKKQQWENQQTNNNYNDNNKQEKFNNLTTVNFNSIVATIKIITNRNIIKKPQIHNFSKKLKKKLINYNNSLCKLPDKRKPSKQQHNTLSHRIRESLVVVGLEAKKEYHKSPNTTNLKKN